MRRPTIYVLPINGLCNRLQAIAAGCALAKAENARLVVVWEAYSGIGCAFEELFEKSTDFELISFDRRGSIREKMKSVLWNDLGWYRGLVPLSWIYRMHLRLRFGKTIFWYADATLQASDVSEPALVSALRSNRRILVVSWYTFYGANSIDFKQFCPLPPEQMVIDRFRENFGAVTVGVHIRRTDSWWAIERSPTEMFAEAMQACIEKEPETRFFLATDCLETEAAMKARFGDRLMTRPRSLSRETVSGMKDALVDLYLLAQTDRILGSYGSTFSTTAAALGGRELVIVGENAA